jgi:hypothetical protein
MNLCIDHEGVNGIKDFIHSRLTTVGPLPRLRGTLVVNCIVFLLSAYMFGLDLGREREVGLEKRRRLKYELLGD